MSAGQPEVRVSAGTVRGARQDGVARFLGIPFARPPVGALRLAAPQPARSWSGVREATAYGPPPPQAALLGLNELVQGEAGDWLTVNVWSPALAPPAGLPVLVWVQGGGYAMGTASLPEYEGSRLAREGGVVVVTFNYRVGLEGFAHLTGAPANRGLLDQVAALEWVRENIGAFGGDPARVTLFGQSAGAGCVAALLAMPAARGLFGQAIAQSVPGAVFSPELATDIAATCAAELGLRPTRADWSTVDPAALAAFGDNLTLDAARRASRWGRPGHRLMPIAPVVDGAVLPVSPWRAVAEGAARDIPLVVGHTRDEHRLFSLILGTLGQVTEEQAAQALDTFAPDPAAYRGAYPEAGAEELFELVHADWLFRMPTLHLAEAQARAGGRAHLFELTWQAPGMGGILGACHGLDVPLTFGNLTQGQPATLLDGHGEALSEHIRAAWTGFATHGDPGWPAYDPRTRLTQVYDTTPTVTPYPEETSRQLWQDHTFTALPLLT
ncbi:para-nitrobenzyl esterase [Crossiella equi]|uniref:Carboxylic ester hydrolase n=1 Tax=Crossiella equi TaxID=130796 RepID=A0ABS5A3U3_9PSEU|nr:carboxylesterase family protein [Crossiella equi]MBP2471245.1 para-nitrobenzyl esterase [Crossiella equi]